MDKKPKEKNLLLIGAVSILFIIIIVYLTVALIKSKSTPADVESETSKSTYTDNKEKVTERVVETETEEITSNIDSDMTEDPEIQSEVENADIPVFSAIDLYEQFLRSGEYLKYVSDDWYYGEPSQYSIFDIDGDGIEELLIFGNDSEWDNLEVFTIDPSTQQIILIQAMDYESGDEPQKVDSITSYCGFEYSQKYHALVYRQLNNGTDYDFVSFDVINNGIIDNAFVIGFDTDYDTNEKEYYLWNKDDGKVFIDKAGFETYVSEWTSISWSEIPK